MASKTPLFRAIASRQYAAGQAATKPFAASGSNEVKTTVLSNKLVLSYLDNNAPLSRISILFRAGSRYETADNLGASHVLRIAAGLGTQGASQFAITRNLQQCGANLTADVGREHVAYTLEATSDSLEACLQYLLDSVTKTAFKPWELDDSIPRMKYELAGLSPQTKVVDLLHKAAYRSGLGNSLFCPERRIGKIGSETMQHYVNELFRSSRAAIASVGVSQNIVVPMAQNLNLDIGDGPGAVKSVFKGDELREDTNAHVTFVALAAEGASIQNSKEALAFAVLQQLFGSTPHVKWSPAAASSSLGKAVVSAAGDEAAAAAGLNISYSDSGLFGAVVAAPSSVIGKVVDAAARSLRSISVTDADVTRAKSQLKAATLLSVESGAGIIEAIGLESLLKGTVTPISQVISQIDSISTSDVSAAARKVSSGKLAMASIGNLANVPYLDQLK